MHFKKVLLLVSITGFYKVVDAQHVDSILHAAPAPLFRDPITDGAADPVVIWNREEKSWWMLYSQRRANTEAPDVAY